MKDEILAQLRSTLRSQADEALRLKGEGYFKQDEKEKMKMYGMRAATVTQIGKECLKGLAGEPKDFIFHLCTELWKSGMMEESFIACQWAFSCKKHFTEGDLGVFERWVDLYVNNWASCDTLCNHTIGTLIEKFPNLVSELKRWAHSPNRWMRRAAAVTLIVPARKGLFLEDIFEIATILLHDREDMVQKGYGWMLKVAGDKHRQEVFDFVMKHRATMPRTALRYAIEKMPPELKAQAMQRV